MDTPISYIITEPPPTDVDDASLPLSGYGIVPLSKNVYKLGTIDIQRLSSYEPRVLEEI